MRLFVLPVLVGLLGLVACSSDDDGGTNSTSQATTACVNDTRKDVYETKGVKKQAADFELKVTDVANTPSDKPEVAGPVQKGMNAFTVVVLDKDAYAVDNAAVTLNLWMPDHGHGSARAPVITPLGGGKYRVTEVWLPMAGLWRFTIGVTPTGGEAKTADFNFCIDG